MRYIVVCSPKNKRQEYTPMAYGRDKEPAQDVLLIRNRATAFATEADAWDHLNRTLRLESELKKSWIENFIFNVMPVEDYEVK